MEDLIIKGVHDPWSLVSLYCVLLTRSFCPTVLIVCINVIQWSHHPMTIIQLVNGSLPSFSTLNLIIPRTFLTLSRSSEEDSVYNCWRTSWDQRGQLGPPYLEYRAAIFTSQAQERQEITIWPPAVSSPLKIVHSAHWCWSRPRLL